MIKKHPSILPTHPGAFLRELVLPTLDMSKADIARALGVSRQSLYDILNGKKPVTAPTALRLGKLLNNGGRFWISMQANYDLEMAARNIDLSTTPTAKSTAA